MRPSRCWGLFAGCALAWLMLFLFLAPSLSGADVYFFRDAGWNLAQWGSFESAALPYMRDLAPRFYAHYPPLVPLSFAAYAAVFPRNAYAGTVFNLLLGFAAAAVALSLVLRQPAGRLRTVAAWAVVLLCPAFTTYDRPEAAALVLFAAALVFAALPGPRPLLAGALIALVFLAEPFAAIVAALWLTALYLSHHWNGPGRWTVTLKQLAVMAVSAVAVLIPVVLFYYAIDQESLARFASHALGIHSGLGVALKARSGKGFVDALREGIFSGPIFNVSVYVLSLSSCCVPANWSFVHRKSLHHAEWLPILAGLTCTLFAVAFFPAQPNYVSFMAFSIPIGLLVANSTGTRLATPALAMLLLAIMIQLPGLGIRLIEGYEQRPSYLAAREQASFLRAHLPSPDAVVVLAGDFYDFFKPGVHHLVGLDYIAEDVDHFAKVAAVANCYDAFHGVSGDVRPLPEQLKASEFHLIQPAPQHLWITVLGDKIMRGQWGYGCDLYVRNRLPDSSSH